MSHDPCKEYAERMRSVEVSSQLIERVQTRVSNERAAHNAPFRKAGASSSARSGRPNRMAWNLGLAACLSALALVVGLSIFPMGGAPSSRALGFTVKAYASNDVAITVDDKGNIVFDIDALSFIPAEGRYNEEGFYTGCLFRIEGDGIVRVQAHLDKGELYRYRYDEFVRSADPERFAEAARWKTSLIGQGERFAAYDLVTVALGDDGKDRNDPDKLVATKCYQRLGATVDIELGENGSRLEDYCFGLWTNEPVPAGSQDSIEAYIDTLDGAELTITVEKEDGTCSTKVIALSAGDVDARIVANDQGDVLSYELAPDGKPDEGDGERDSLHTLRGTVVEENREPFPYGRSSRPTPNKPLTEPFTPNRTETASDASDNSADEGPTFDANDLAELGESYTFDCATQSDDFSPVTASLTCTVTDVKRLDNLPAEIATSGKTLPPGNSYVLVAKTVKNNSDRAVDVQVSIGRFATLDESASGKTTSTYQGASEPLWRSGSDEPAWHSHRNFELLAPGESFEFEMLFAVPDEALEDDGLAFVAELETSNGYVKAYRIGALA